MTEMSRVTQWHPPVRPEWLSQLLDETQHMDLRALIPLDSQNLIDTARRNTGLEDFGDDDWREPFEILCRALDEEADLHAFGRMMTRNELLLQLQNRLQIEATYKAHPEIEDEIIDSPVIIAGLPRSGTSILFELLSQDKQFRSPSSWETIISCPPPETSSYGDDPRVDKVDHLLTQWSRVTPTYASMHEMGAWIPAECFSAFELSFRSENMTAKVPVPSFMAWLATADMTPAYRYYKRMLKLLQWKNPRQHWLLKSPAHLGYLPTLFKVFPDARLVITHRDPIKAQASVTNLLGTLFWMRSDKRMDVADFESLLNPEAVAYRLYQTIDWLESGTIPGSQVFSSRYADLLEAPIDNIQRLYREMGLELKAPAADAMSAYLRHKPKGKFGVHRYELGQREQIARERAHYQRYQDYFDVPNEAE